MFYYTGSKGSCWGHVIRPKNPTQAKLRVNAFFESYFERLVPEWEVTRQISLLTTWKTSALPNVEWPPDFAQPQNQKIFFIVTGDRVSFMGGIPFPISSAQAASYDFLRQFVSDAPFRMRLENFRVRVLGSSDRWSWKKPEGEIGERLRTVFD